MTRKACVASPIPRPDYRGIQEPKVGAGATGGSTLTRRAKGWTSVPRNAFLSLLAALSPERREHPSSMPGALRA
jgi:hypothetical protein